MLAALVAGLLPFGTPWDKPVPPPPKAVLVLIQPAPPDPPPPGSIIDVPSERELPERWRSSDSASPKARENAGLNGLMASGSGQFCRDQFYALRAELRQKSVVIVDLRQEPHTFLDGAAVAWGPPEVVGVDRSATEVEREEMAWTRHLDAGDFASITQYASQTYADTKDWWPLALKLDIRSADVESRLVAEAHWGYFRIVAPDTVLPRDADVDRFIDLIRDLDPGLWLHFHCDTGGNRTTLYLTLYDMMRNYLRASRDQIITRQRKLGGYDLLAGPGKADCQDFLHRFFDYCWQCGPLFRKSWASWDRAYPAGKSPASHPPAAHPDRASDRPPNQSGSTEDGARSDSARP